QFGGPVRERAALVAGRRRAGEAQAGAPVAAGRREHEGEQAAGQRLGVGAAALVNEAAVAGAEEDAAAVGAAVQLRAARPPRALAHKQPHALEILDVVPAEGLDALALRLADLDLQLAAAVAAAVAVPVLHGRQVPHGEGHETLW